MRWSAPEVDAIAPRSLGKGNETYSSVRVNLRGAIPPSMNSEFHSRSRLNG